MSTYTPPLRDMRFVLRELAGLDAVAQLPGCEEATPDVADAILDEAGKFAAGVLDPLNVVGDRNPVALDNGTVKTAPGWTEAYRQFIAGGWNAFSCPPEYGGQGLPRLISTLVEEMWNSANMSFALCPMLTRGAVDALDLKGSEVLKNAYLPRIVSGEWSGTMNLTEPQAGSDLSAIRTRAVPQADGSYKIFGQKIFITYGDHELTPNIVHLVLARTPNAPEGVKGISMFLVPKFLPKADGTPDTRNDVHCVSLENKLGIHASPTCVMAYGDHGGATGYLVGEENQGLPYMFIMMNAARFAVGLEGIGLSERAYQHALAYAKERVQGVEAGIKGGGKVAIIRHPDVRRMLMLMKSQTEAMRALACVVAAAMDTARCHADAATRQQNQAFVDLMIPIVKGWSTENAIGIASLGVQIHGGMGFIEEAGAAQYLRDARITAIYEGTTGIQANDLIGRKIARDNGGQTIKALIATMRGVAQELAAANDAELAAIHRALALGIDALDDAMAYVLATYDNNVKQASVGAVPFLKLFGIVAGGWQMARAALVAKRRLAENAADTAFHQTKITTARFYADHVLSQATGLSYAVVNGADGALQLADEQF